LGYAAEETAIVSTTPPSAGMVWNSDDEIWVADWAAIRKKRNTLLLASDHTQLVDSPVSSEQRTAWAEYRQELRNLPQNFSTPQTVVWPEKPE
jgi:hypothetical protein